MLRLASARKSLTQKCLQTLSCGRRSRSALAGIQPGHEIEGFEVTQVCNVPDYNLSPVVRLEHRGTGAQYLHMGRSDDTNNAFAIAFRTSPRDSTGLPHILEHTTLCGSKRFPVRDPFFKMLNRSLASFMNAMTGPDFTVYPFSTPNERDYKQLLSVYLDAVFNPMLRDQDFMQEGWRLEHEVVGDPTSKIIFRGVVFNEMKGVYADPQVILMMKLLNNLLPSDTYVHDFGGDPLSIPKLTVQDLRNFHAQCYHPSNSRIVSYGQLPLDQTLRQLQNDYLAHFKRQKPIPGVPREKRWTEPKTVRIACAPDPLGAASNPEKQATTALAFLCGDATQVYETFSLGVISSLLLSGPTSVLHRALIEPGFGDSFASCTGFEAQTRDTYFAVGLQGVAESQFEEISEATMKALTEVRDKGFDAEHLEAILHSMELGAKTQKASFGLNAALALLPSWNHGADPLEALNTSAMIARLRKQLKDQPKYLESMLDQYLCSNTHRLTISMTPSQDYETKKAQREDKLLSDKIRALDRSQLDEVLDQGIKLQEEQMRPADVSCLPTLSMSDLATEPHKYEVNDKVFARGVPVQVSPQPTNGVTHFYALLDASRLDPVLRKDYLPLFLALASSMGTAKNDYRQFDRKIQLSTSGLGVSSHIFESPNDTNEFMDSVLLSSICVNRNVNQMMEIWQELLTQPSYHDRERLETLVRAIAAELANGIAFSGHRYAVANASSRLTSAAQLRENNSGLKFIARMKEFASANGEQLEEVLKKLQEVANTLFNSNIRCAVNVNPGDAEASALKHLEATFSKLQNPGFNALFTENAFTQSPGTVSSQLHVLPLPVGYLGRSISTGVSYSHPDFASLCIAGKVLSARYLHAEVREKGGAYGSGASMNNSGIFTMYSYRDPEASKGTGRVFDSCAAWLMNTENYNSEHVTEAKLGLFQRIDAPIAPGNRGMDRFLQTIDLEQLQNHRLRLQSVTTEDVVRVAAKYLDTKSNPLPVANTLLGPACNELDGSWEVLTN